MSFIVSADVRSSVIIGLHVTYVNTLRIHVPIIFGAIVSGFEKKGHFAPDLNFEILISSEIIGNQLTFAACFMFIAARIHFLCAFI